MRDTNLKYANSANVAGISGARATSVLIGWPTPPTRLIDPRTTMTYQAMATPNSRVLGPGGGLLTHGRVLPCDFLVRKDCRTLATLCQVALSSSRGALRAPR